MALWTPHDSFFFSLKTLRVRGRVRQHASVSPWFPRGVVPIAIASAWLSPFTSAVLKNCWAGRQHLQNQCPREFVIFRGGSQQPNSCSAGVGAGGRQVYRVRV